VFAAPGGRGRLHPVTDADHVREQLEKLAELECSAQELVDRPHYHMHDGRPVPDPVTGEPLRDDGPVLRGLGVLIEVSRQRIQLLGLETPQRHHLVDEKGSTIDITALAAALRGRKIVSVDEG
jgi:hypothetical protein